MDIDFAVHGDSGPLSGFAVGAQPGDRLLLVAPAPDAAPDVGVAWRPAAARRLLCVGDETALPAIRNILGTLSADQTCDVLIEVPDAFDVTELPSAAAGPHRLGGPASRRVRRRPRRGGHVRAAPPARRHPATRIPTSGRRPPARPEDRYAWVAGEVAWVNRVRKHLATRGYTGANASFMGYWRAGHPSRG